MAAIAPQLIGESPEFHILLDWISDLASLECPVLITGERGTGKELVASRLHFLSSRWEQAYQSINCAAYDAEDFNGLMYGEHGQSSLLDRLEGGTLFLDKIDTLDRPTQERLARVIEYNEYDSRDGTDPQDINIRFLASLTDTGSDARENKNLSADLVNRIAFDGSYSAAAGSQKRYYPPAHSFWS